MKEITDKQRVDFMSGLLAHDGISFRVRDADDFLNWPNGGIIELFTVRTQHIGGNSLRELIDAAILRKPKVYPRWDLEGNIERVNRRVEEKAHVTPPTEKGESDDE